MEILSKSDFVSQICTYAILSILFLHLVTKLLQVESGYPVVKKISSSVSWSTDPEEINSLFTSHVFFELFGTVSEKLEAQI